MRLSYEKTLNELILTASRVSGYAKPPNIERVGFWHDGDTGNVMEVSRHGLYQSGLTADSIEDAVIKIRSTERYFDFMGPTHFGRCTLFDVTPDQAEHWSSLPPIESA